MIKRILSKNILIQILQYFFVIIATIVLFYGIFYIIFSSYFNGYIERFKGALTIPIIVGDMLGVECATIFPVIIPFIIVFGYLKSKRIYIPIISVILLTPFLPFIFQIDSFSSYRMEILIFYVIEIIFGIILAYFFKYFLWIFKKLENKMHDILIFILKILTIVGIYFLIFYIIYFLFFVNLINLHAIYYFYARYSSDVPPVAPYYLYSLSIILSFFLGANKKHLIYSGLALITIIFLFNIIKFDFSLSHLYLPDTFVPPIFILFSISEYFRYNDILSLLLTFFSSSFLYILISQVYIGNNDL